MFFILRKKGQSVFEFAVLIVIVLGALLTISVYFKRGIQGRWKAAVDDMGDQYDPRVTNSDITYGLQVDAETRILATPGSSDGTGGVWTTRYETSNSVQTQNGFSRVGGF